MWRSKSVHETNGILTEDLGGCKAGRIPVQAIFTYTNPLRIAMGLPATAMC